MEVIRDKDNLNREVWNFGWLDRILILNNYFIQKRETNRHKWVTVKDYDRLKSRDNKIQETEVPFPKDVSDEALNKGCAMIKVYTWGEYKNSKHGM